MTEENRAPVPDATETAAGVTAPAAPAATDSAAIDLERYLDLTDRDAARRHPVVAGIVGDLLEKERARIRHELTVEQEAAATVAAATAERDRLRELRRTDPPAYAEEMEQKEAETEYQDSLTKLRGETRTEFAARIASAVGRSKEWAEIKADPVAAKKLTDALAGKADDDAVEAFVETSTDLIAERRAQQRLGEWKSADLAKERAAIRTEERAAALKSGASPDISKPRTGQPSSPLDTLPPGEDFNRAYEKLVLRRG